MCPPSAENPFLWVAAFLIRINAVQPVRLGGESPDPGLSETEVVHLPQSRLCARAKQDRFIPEVWQSVKREREKQRGERRKREKRLRFFLKMANCEKKKTHFMPSHQGALPLCLVTLLS